MNLPQRISPRRNNYDYGSPWGYFVTICTKWRQYYFGEIVDGIMTLNNIGTIIDQYILSIPNHFPHVEVHDHVVMPNHVHILLLTSKLPDDRRDANTARPIDDTNEKTARPIQNNNEDTANSLSIEIPQMTARDAVPTTTKPLIIWPWYGSLWYIINQLKSTCTREINKQSAEWTIKIPYWDTFARQPRYHDRIIRNQLEYDRIKYYIITNPQNRESDTFNK